MMNRKKRSQGFSLIELLIVVTIILILAAIAIPKLLTVKQQANSTAAVANTKSLLNALTAYQSQYTSQGYPATMAALGGANPCTPALANACLVDNSLATATAAPGYQGYIFTYADDGVVPSQAFTLNADPVSAATSNRHFFTDNTDIIRYSDGAAASAASAVIGQ